MPAYDLRPYPLRHPFALVAELRRGLLPATAALDAVGGDLVTSASRGLPSLHHVRHPDLVREVLVDRNADLHKARGLRLARVILGDGLLTAEAPQHTRQRRLVLPAFHHRRLVGYGATMARLAAEEAERWADGEVVDATAAAHRLTLAIAGETLFGADVGEATGAIAEALDQAFAGFDASQFPLADKLTWLPTPAQRRTRAARDTLDAIVYGLIAERRAAARPGDDLLQMLIDARDADTDAPMTDREIRDEALTLLLAGHETTAVALAWTLRALADHDDAQTALHAELDALGRDAAFDDLRALPVTRAVVSEAMRLRPPAWAFSREAWRDTALGGRAVRRGDTVLVAPYFLHRDARWWPEPARFRLDRWLGGEAGRPEPARAGPAHKFAYLPFSAGQRGCIGEPFAWAELVLSLAALARRWRVEAVGPAPGLSGTVTLRPSEPVRLRVARREPAS